MTGKKYGFELDCFCVGAFGTNLFIVYDEDSKDAILIDPGIGSEFVLNHIREKGLSLKYIVNTHGHFDHIYNNSLFKESTNACLCCHRKDEELLKVSASQGLKYGIEVPSSPLPDKFLEDNDILELNEKINFRIIHAPGHSQGSICLYSKGFLFCGDVLFEGSIGRTDLPGGNHTQLICSIKNKLLVLPEDTIVLSGHGENTTIGREKKSNPFLTDSTLR